MISPHTLPLSFLPCSPFSSSLAAISAQRRTLCLLSITVALLFYQSSLSLSLFLQKAKSCLFLTPSLTWVRPWRWTLVTSNLGKSELLRPSPTLWAPHTLPIPLLPHTWNPILSYHHSHSPIPGSPCRHTTIPIPSYLDYHAVIPPFPHTWIPMLSYFHSHSIVYAFPYFYSPTPIPMPAYLHSSTAISFFHCSTFQILVLALSQPHSVIPPFRYNSRLPSLRTGSTWILRISCWTYGHLTSTNCKATSPSFPSPPSPSPSYTTFWPKTHYAAILFPSPVRQTVINCSLPLAVPFRQWGKAKK